MSKFNFKSQKEVIGFLLSVIRSGEKLSIEDENEILRFALDSEWIKNLTTGNVPEMKNS
jgi:hypothetical protein